MGTLAPLAVYPADPRLWVRLAILAPGPDRPEFNGCERQVVCPWHFRQFYPNRIVETSAHFEEVMLDNRLEFCPIGAACEGLENLFLRDGVKNSRSIPIEIGILFRTYTNFN